MDSKLMIFNEPDGQTLYNLSNTQFSIEKSDGKTTVYNAPDNNSNFNTCIRLGTSKTNCQNRIQFVATINENKVIGCGSAALVPTCYVFNDKSEVLSEFPASGLISDNAVDQPLTKILRKSKSGELNILSVAYDRASVAAIHLVQIKTDLTTGNMHSKTIKTHKFTSNENTNQYQTIVEYNNNLIVVGTDNQNKGISYRLCRNDPGTIQDSNQFSRIVKSHLACKHDGVTFNNLVATRSANNNIVGLFKNDYGTETAVCLFPLPDFTSGSSGDPSLDCQTGQLTQNAAVDQMDLPEAIQSNALYIHPGLIDSLTIHQEESSDDFILYLLTSEEILKKTVLNSKLYHNHVIHENPFTSGATVVRWKNKLKSSSTQLELEHCKEYKSCQQCFASYDIDCQQFDIETEVCQPKSSAVDLTNSVSKYDDCPDSNNSKFSHQNIDQGSDAVLPISIVENNLQLATGARWYFEDNLIEDDDQQFSMVTNQFHSSLIIYKVDENTFGSYSLDVTQNDMSIFNAYFEVSPTESIDGISDTSGNKGPSPMPPSTDISAIPTGSPTTISSDSNLVPEAAGVPFLLFILVIVLLIAVFSASLIIFVYCLRSRRKGKLVVMGHHTGLGERGEAAGAENVDEVFIKEGQLEIEPMLKSGIESGIQSDLNLADSIDHATTDHATDLHETDTRNSPNGQSNSTEYYSCRSSSESYNSPNGTISKNSEDVIIWCPKNNTLKRISYDKLLKHEVNHRLINSFNELF